MSDDNQLPGSATVSNTFGSASPSLSGTGGPQVLAIAPGGPAHDNGDAGLAGVPTDDQRGLPRDGSPDLGAFEIQ